MLSPAVKIFLCAQPADMRRSFDKLAEMTRSVLAQDPLSGHLFVFFNRPRDRVKILFWDRSGFCLYYRRFRDRAAIIFEDGGSEEFGGWRFIRILYSRVAR